MLNRITYFVFPFILILISNISHGLVVLQYHHVDNTSPSSTSVTPQQFLQHMQLIEDLGLEVVDLESASRKLLIKSSNENNNQPDGKPQVAISFDDAYYSIYANAYPELRRRNWPFTIFVNTQAVNERNRGIMSWSQIKELVDNGVSIANHSVSHAHLPSIPVDLTLTQWLDQEVLQAQQDLLRRLGKVGNMLAYPYGEFTLAMIPWLEQHNLLAFGQQSGPIGELSHPQALSRFPASGIYADLTSLKTKLLSLALPIEKSQLKNPMIATENNPPELSIALLERDYDAERIQCFASQQGAINTKVELINNQRTLTTQALLPLNGKRGRYNCTVMSSQKGRFYWYSQPWQMY
jgi:peptidoglycan/xylan/chitin deacetylase (PgdA/CDA1 family)